MGQMVSLNQLWPRIGLGRDAGSGHEYRFQLRQGVQFHDGAAWDCSVAKLNFDHVLAKPLTTGDWHGWYDLVTQVKSWSCNAANEFVVTTQDKYYPLLQELTYIRPLRMLSPTMFANGASTDPTTHNSCHAGWGSITGNGETITCAGILGVSGTGPYRYNETLPNGDVRFDRNEAHRSQPKVETIIVKKYASHADVMAALQDGTLDAVLGAGVLEPVDLRTLQINHADEFQVFLGPPIMNRVIILNSNKAPTDGPPAPQSHHACCQQGRQSLTKNYMVWQSPVDALFPKNAPYCDVDLTSRSDLSYGSRASIFQRR